jgi:tRNA (guanine10-N2)-dimethyltransferase
MSYIYRLSGENLELAEAELEGFLRSQNIQEGTERRGRIAETGKEPEMLKRLALTHEVSRKKAELELDKLEEKEINIQSDESFAVKCKVIEGEKDPQEIEEILGEKIISDKNSVDLEEPNKIYKAYILDQRIVIGEEVLDIKRGLFQDRSNEKRPFSSPVSLDPVLARVMINLAEVPGGGKMLDPFCGTGGILIEAGLCGILPLGTDNREEMVDGTEKNLGEYGIINHDIRQGKAENSIQKFDDTDAIVTDLPYGKSSKKEGEIEETLLKLIDSFEGKTVFMYNKPRLEDYEANYQIYQHKNLTRYIYSISDF